MLQQTRVAAVIPYYETIPRELPGCGGAGARAGRRGVGAVERPGLLFARAQSAKSRAADRCSRRVSAAITRSIRELPGVGEYTAAAIASIAFGLPHAVVDGNVRRVIVAPDQR